MQSDRAIAALLLLPAAALALPPPLAPLADDPFPNLAGAGWAAVLALPAVAASALTGGGKPRAALLLPLVPLALGLAMRAAGWTSDTLEADRALVMLVAFTGLAASASGLGERGRELFARGLVLVSIGFSAVALLRPLELGYGGTLGNSGLLSQAALPGAVGGALHFATRRGVARALGLLAAALFARHSALAPVLTGAVAFGAALGAAALLVPVARAAALWRAAVLGIAAIPILLVASGRAFERPSRSGEPAAAGVTGGLLVRARIFARVPALVLDHALLGAGPGQTAAAFPPYRDPAEIELSTHERRAGADVEIDHVHSDWLQGFADAGLSGGLAWALFLALGGLAAARALRRGPEADAALGAGALGLLVNALAHEPLLQNPAAMLMAAALLGAALAGGGRAALLGRPLAAALALALLAAAPIALELIEHGRALSERTRLVRRHAAWEQGPGAAESAADALRSALLYWRAEGRLLERALDARPDSVPARLLLAEHERAGGKDDEAALIAVLARRPHHVQALVALGVCAAERGDVAGARARFERALALDPGHPEAAYDLASLLLAHGDPERGLAVAQGLAAHGRLSERSAERLASHQFLTGALDRGLALLALAHPDVPNAAPELMEAIAESARADAEETIADALMAAAHWRWAREHREAGRAHDAVRSYRQAELALRRHAERGAPALSAEHAAALVLDADLARAREQLAGLAASDLAALPLPEWARQALADAGLP